MTELKITAVAAILFASTSVWAAGAGVINVKSSNDSFTNGDKGTISAKAEATGGVATAVAAQRAITPIADGVVNYTSTNNRYDNFGVIQSSAKAVGGVATAVAGQEVVN